MILRFRIPSCDHFVYTVSGARRRARVTDTGTDAVPLCVSVRQMVDVLADQVADHGSANSGRRGLSGTIGGHAASRCGS